jgi:hypothetical protein
VNAEPGRAAIPRTGETEEGAGIIVYAKMQGLSDMLFEAKEKPGGAITIYACSTDETGLMLGGTKLLEHGLEKSITQRRGNSTGAKVMESMPLSLMANDTAKMAMTERWKLNFKERSL